MPNMRQEAEMIFSMIKEKLERDLPEEDIIEDVMTFLDVIVDDLHEESIDDW